MLGIKLKVPYRPSKHSTNRATPSIPAPNHSMQTSITCFQFGTSKLPEGHLQVRPWPDCVPLTSPIRYRVDRTPLVTQSSREHIPQGRDMAAAASFLPPQFLKSQPVIPVAFSCLVSKASPSSRREVELALVSQREILQHIPSPC